MEGPHQKYIDLSVEPEGNRRDRRRTVKINAGKLLGAHIRTGYMCKIDFDYELGCASGGSRVYPSQRDLRACHKMADDCGIVEVQVTLIRVISPGTDK